MFTKVLIAEDHEMTSISVTKTMRDLGISETEYTYYCDDALMLIKKAIAKGQPFDLLITDLSFEEDHRKQRISGGTELIALAKTLQADLKVLVFSAENKPALVDGLFKDLGIDGYVRKARHDAKDLRAAMETIFLGKTYLSADLKQSVKEKNTFEFTSFDITIISLLSGGTLQKNIPDYLQANHIKPSGLSSVEKRLNVMKEVLGFSKNEQLVAYCKDFGII
ncbi:probable capsular synthesis response regulator transcription regulator protein [Pedobacter sp. BAL39]|uniref:response regulator n=1 Tax=Pedobacter sp. BAL39 TaxID=391596 RepID=UPI0001559239|nr:response regulator [Pedobacter sp. BAL39]EDM35353.1 probable capsular synthesis response regulator transcription regulator protein [Pedobacter sp. BAL39]